MTSPYDDAQQYLPYKPFPPNAIPTPDQILSQLFPEPGDPPVEHYITPADLAYAWTAFLSMIDAWTGRIRTGPNPPSNSGASMVPPPRIGDMYVDTTLGDLWQFTGAAWRMVTRYGNPFTIGPGDPLHITFPTASRDGDLHYDTLTNVLWAHDLGTGWHAVSQGPPPTPGVQVLNDLLDVDTTGLRNGTALVYSAVQKQWMPVVMPKPTQFRGAVADTAALAGIPNPFDGDLAVTRDDGHLHVYLAASGWDNIGPVAASTVADGTADGDVLMWDVQTGMWLPSADYLGDESNVFYAPGGDPATDHGVPIYNPGVNEWNVQRLSVSDLAETWLITPADGDTIVWDATNAVWVVKAGGVSALSSLTDVDTLNTPPVGGDALIYSANANKWLPGSPSPRLPEWDKTTNYPVGSVVHHNGRLWRARTANGGTLSTVEPDLRVGAATVFWMDAARRAHGPTSIEFVQAGPTNTAPTGVKPAVDAGTHIALRYVSDTDWSLWLWDIDLTGWKAGQPIPAYSWVRVATTGGATVWRNYATPAAPAVRSSAVLWVYGPEKHTTAPVVPQTAWEPIALTNFLVALADVNAANAVAGDVLVSDGSGKWNAQPLKSSKQMAIVFTGDAAFIPANIGNQALNYGMAATTTPDPKANPPKVGDIYVNTVNDDVVRFTGAAAAHATEQALLAAVQAALAGFSVSSYSSPSKRLALGASASLWNGNIVITQTGHAPQQGSIDFYFPTHGVLPPVGTVLGFREDWGGHSRTFSYTIAAGDVDIDTLVASLDAAAKTQLGGDYTVVAGLSGDVEFQRTGYGTILDGPLGAPAVALSGWADMWGGFASTEAFDPGHVDVTVGLVTNVSPPLTLRNEVGKVTIVVPSDGSLGNNPIQFTVNGQAISVTPVHTLGYYIEDRDGAVSGDALVFDGSKWLPRSVPTVATIDAKIAALLQGIEHGMAVQDIVTAPPAKPATDEVWIVGVGGTGAFATHDNALALWDGAAWVFTAPQANEAHLNEADNGTYHWNGTAWVKVAAQGIKTQVITRAAYTALGTAVDPATLYLITV